MRLIDGDVLIEKFNEKADMAECLIDERTSERFANFCALADAVEESTTVDAVEVVRCKECKWAGGDFVCYRGVMVQHKPEDFCSYGERRGGGEDG